MVYKKDTIVAVATPPGKGAVGIIRVSGPNSRTIAEKILGFSPIPRHAHFTNIPDVKQQVIDQALVIFFPAPSSYTGEDVLEVQGHGGSAVLSLLQDRILELGARPANPGEFTERAFLNNKIDLIQAEAVADLIDSVSTQAAKSAMRSLCGNFSDQLNQLFEKMVAIRVQVESALDFSEEEIDLLDEENISEKIKECIDEINIIYKLSLQGARLRDSTRIIIIGPPNVGKSSLMNQLTGENTAIVHTRAGTTRDIIREEVKIGGHIIQLFDTAGIRKTHDEIEEEGIKRAFNAARESDLVLLMFEHGQNPDELDSLIKNVPVNLKKIFIANKIDIYSIKAARVNNEQGVQINLSAKTGEGIDILMQYIENEISEGENIENVILARQRHLDAIKKTGDCLSAAQQAQIKNNPELIAEELRLAQEQLANILGKFTADDLLGEIFSRFCIGK